MKHQTTLVLALTVILWSTFLPNESLSQSGDSLMSKVSHGIRNTKHDLSFEIGGDLATGSFASDFDMNSSLKDNLEGNQGGFGAKAGPAFSFGGNFILSKQRKTTFGIKAVFLHKDYFNYEWIGGITSQADYESVHFTSCKLGGLMRINLSHVALVDLYFQCGPMISRKGSWSYESTSSNSQDHGYFNLNNGFGVTNEFGLKLNFEHIVIGLSYNYNLINYSATEFYRFYDVEKNGIHYFVEADEATEAKMNVTYFTLTLGIRFGKKGF